VIVPNHSRAACSKTQERCAFHASACSGGTLAVESQNERTAGCMEETSATEESPCASARKIWATSRVDVLTSRHIPPASAGTPVNEKPAARSASKSA
jgi:hypothetical protein